MQGTSIFKGRNALVIGAGQNIGQKIAMEFARRGASVVVADINSEGAEETAAMIVEAGGKARGVAVDVTSEMSIARCVEEAETFFGVIDIHVNNAGLLYSGNVEDIPPAEWERMFDVNLFGAVRANAVVLPMMIARGSGHIVNTASFAGLYPYATNRIPYAASKAALISMSENMAIHLESLGIRVSCLCPGPTMTTSIHGMRTFGENVQMRGPGSDLEVKSQEDVATILADGMEAGRILIPTHPKGFETIGQYANAPDDFIRAVAADFAAGRNWLPGQHG